MRRDTPLLGPRRLALIAAMAVLIALGLRARLSTDPESPMFETLGMSGPGAADGRRCERIAHRAIEASWRRWTVLCQARGAVDAPGRPHEQATFDYLSRRLYGAARSFGVADSATFERTVDSVRTALAARGGTPMLLPADVRRGAASEMSCWRYPGYDVRLVAHRFRAASDPYRDWRVQLDAWPTHRSTCQLLSERVLRR